MSNRVVGLMVFLIMVLCMLMPTVCHVNVFDYAWRCVFVAFVLFFVVSLFKR